VKEEKQDADTLDDVCTQPTFVCISKSSGESIAGEEEL